MLAVIGAFSGVEGHKAVPVGRVGGFRAEFRYRSHVAFTSVGLDLVEGIKRVRSGGCIRHLEGRDVW